MTAEGKAVYPKLGRELRGQSSIGSCTASPKAEARELEALLERMLRKRLIFRPNCCLGIDSHGSY